MKKRCSKCKEFKLLKEFSKNKNYKDGLNYTCKNCINKQQNKNRKIKEGLITIIYFGQKGSAKQRQMILPIYTKTELQEWLFNQDLFHKLYDDWVKNGYKKGLKPSVDRINDYKSYTLDNIQLMTFKENRIKGDNDRKNGINNKKSKTVLQFDLNGDFIKEYYSAS